MGTVDISKAIVWPVSKPLVAPYRMSKAHLPHWELYGSTKCGLRLPRRRQDIEPADSTAELCLKCFPRATSPSNGVLTERERAILQVLLKPEGKTGMHPGRIGRLAFPKSNPGRRDTGTRNTILAMERKGLVKRAPNNYVLLPDEWLITDLGKKALKDA
jgi:hypothetical protein